jgi:nitroreductase
MDPKGMHMESNQSAMEFLHSRRSRPVRLLGLPVPDAAQLNDLLRAAVRVPDHGKLEPWRFVVLTAPACARLAVQIGEYGAAAGIDPDKVTKVQETFGNANLIVSVIASPKPSDKIPVIEQTLSVGAVCLSLVNAALAFGWGANWLTGWVAHDQPFAARLLGLEPQEWVAGFVHIGTSGAIPPDRPRPDIAALTRWATE